MDRLPLEWFFDIPPVTRIWCVSIIACASLDYMGAVSSLKFLYLPSKVWSSSGNHEFWRIFTTFSYFGPLNFNLCAYVFFVSRYSSGLERSLPLRNRSANYAWLLGLACFILVAFASFVTSMPALGPYLAICIIYIWSRRHPDVRVPFLGLFVFHAPYLPFALAVYNMVASDSSNVKGELAGIACGHIIFFFEDIYPTINGGKRPLAPPWEWKWFKSARPARPARPALAQNQQ